MTVRQWLKVAWLSMFDLFGGLISAVFWLVLVGIASSVFLGVPIDLRESLLLDGGARGHLMFALLFIIPTAFAGIVAVRRFRIEAGEDE